MHSRTHLFAAAMLVHGMHQPLTFNDPTVQRSICRVTVVCAMGIFRHAPRMICSSCILEI